MIVSDPNQFQGDIMVSEKRGDWTTLAQSHRYGDGNYRILGMAEMAGAIAAGRPHRAGLELALHVLEIMEAFGSRPAPVVRWIWFMAAPGLRRCRRGRLTVFRNRSVGSFTAKQGRGSRTFPACHGIFPVSGQSPPSGRDGR